MTVRNQPSLLASWERSWSDAGLGSPAIHVEAHGPAAERLQALVGAHLCTPVPGQPGVIRLDPTLDLETLAALLEAAGWQTEREASLLRATAGC